MGPGLCWWLWRRHCCHLSSHRPDIQAFLKTGTGPWMLIEAQLEGGCARGAGLAGGIGTGTPCASKLQGSHGPTLGNSPPTFALILGKLRNPGHWYRSNRPAPCTQSPGFAFPLSALVVGPGSPSMPCGGAAQPYGPLNCKVDELHDGTGCLSMTVSGDTPAFPDETDLEAVLGAAREGSGGSAVSYRPM